MHDEEGHGQDQGNADGHDEPGPRIDPQRATVKAQGQQADGQHNGDRLTQHDEKFLNRVLHDRGLVLNLDEFDPHGQVRLNRRRGGSQ